MNINERFLALVPSGEGKDPIWIFRARVLVAFMISLGVVGMVYWWIYYKLGNPYAGLAILTEAILLWGLIFYFRKHGRLEKTVNICMIAYCIMMFIINSSSGGSAWTAMPWWVVAPVFVTLVAGTKLGLRYFFVAMAVIFGSYFVELLGFSFPQTVDMKASAWLHFLHWFHYFGVVLYISLMTFMFDAINRTAQEQSRIALAKAEDATQRAESQSRYLAESVEIILQQMGSLAKGDLTARLEVRQQDEIGRLCEGFNISVERINSVIVDVLGSVRVTAESSESISQSANMLARGSQEQTDQMNQVAAGISEMVHELVSNATSASNSSDAARSNGQVAREGGKIVQETVNKIDEIAAVVDQSSKSIEELAASSKEIGQIVSVIQDVASRTNLLALNASIEAAHAGAAGRGFGVIADEVKDLANQTAESTEKITHMIQNIQKQTSEVISDMQVGMEQVEKGKILAGQAGNALEEIVSSSENMIELVQAIASASESQAEQSSQFMERISNMKEIVDTSVKEINEIAGSTDQLEELTERVKDQLGRFKVDLSGAGRV